MVNPFDKFFAGNPKPVMTDDRLTNSILDVIVVGNLSFRQAENPALVELLKEAFPRCHPPNRRGVSERLKKEAGLQRIAKREQLAAIDSKVSIALDAWHSKAGNMEFLGIFPWGRDDRQ